MRIVIFNLFLLGFCALFFACGGENLDAYKDKVLEHAASKLNTTKGLLIKDLDIKFDSMSLSYFSVEDSIILLENKYREEVDEQEKWISLCKESIQKLEKENKERKKNAFSSIFTNMNNNSIKENKINIEAAETKIKEIKDKYQSEFNSYQVRDKKEKIYNVFRYHLSLRMPKLGLHQVGWETELFSPDGKTYLKTASKEMKDYLNSKLIK